MTVQSSPPVPPAAQRREIVRSHHGEDVTDAYEWLRDKTDPEVIAHLEAENAYTRTVTADQEPLRQARPDWRDATSGILAMTADLLR